MYDRDRYSPLVMAADATATLKGISVGGFLPVTAGTITIENAQGDTLLAAFPLTAGVFARIPLYTGGTGATVTLGGGASGTLLI